MKWVNRFTPLYLEPKVGRKICDIPEKTLVEPTGAIEGYYEEVIHIVPPGVGIGWVHTNDLEDYIHNFPTNVVTIENQTPDPTDFEQYIVWNRVKQTNLCGELCVANVLGISLGLILETFQREKPSIFKRIFGSGKARGTGYQELIDIFSAFSVPAIPLVEALYESHIGRARYTIKGLNKLLNSGSVIMSVTINGNNGLIQSSGILHWIVLKSIIPERNGLGFTYFYNPAMNNIESDSYAQLMLAAKAVSGVYIPN